ncbi:MAG: hypothetical protein U5R06_05150 [candidate division KSB1 bacterium]|nr:hypothetical protein [candidate division KSB1 bacterium]
MNTVFSHIIQKRFSRENEDVATDALAYILKSSESARYGMIKLLRSIAPNLPDLRFKTQQTEGHIRPDMWGYAEDQPRVFIENKFWAGLTDHQPVSYLEQLGSYEQPTVLFVIAPAMREQTLWRELKNRLAAENIFITNRAGTAIIPCSADTPNGTVIALSSWNKVLSVLEHDCMNDPCARGDLVQLRALCDSADADAYTPVSREAVSDQRTPAFVLQLGVIVQAAVDRAASENSVLIKGLNPQANWDRIGRYIRFPCQDSIGAGAWFGIDFSLWKTHGTSPVWLFFYNTDFGRGQKVRALVEPWAAQEGYLTAVYDHGIAIALEIPIGEEKDAVIRSLADDLKKIAGVLAHLPPLPTSDTKENNDAVSL